MGRLQGTVILVQRISPLTSPVPTPAGNGNSGSTDQPLDQPCPHACREREFWFNGSALDQPCPHACRGNSSVVTVSAPALSPRMQEQEFWFNGSAP